MEIKKIVIYLPYKFEFAGRDIMGKQVIHIYGASGSGTSTIGKYISDKLGFYFMDTDDYFWQATNPPYTIKRNISERLSMMKKDINEHEKVVISGSLVDWGDELIPLFSLAIRVETDTNRRLERLRRREREHFGNRIDTGGDMYENHQEFLNWAAAYDDGGLDMRSKAKHDEWQMKLCCKHIIVDGSLPLEKNFQMIQSYL